MDLVGLKTVCYELWWDVIPMTRVYNTSFIVALTSADQVAILSINQWVIFIFSMDISIQEWEKIQSPFWLILTGAKIECF